MTERRQLASEIFELPDDLYVDAVNLIYVSFICVSKLILYYYIFCMLQPKVILLYDWICILINFKFMTKFNFNIAVN